MILRQSISLAEYELDNSSRFCKIPFAKGVPKLLDKVIKEPRKGERAWMLRIFRLAVLLCVLTFVPIVVRLTSILGCNEENQLFVMKDFQCWTSSNMKMVIVPSIIAALSFVVSVIQIVWMDLFLSIQGIFGTTVYVLPFADQTLLLFLPGSSWFLRLS